MTRLRVRRPNHCVLVSPVPIGAIKLTSAAPRMDPLQDARVRRSEFDIRDLAVEEVVRWDGDDGMGG